MHNIISMHRPSQVWFPDPSAFRFRGGREGGSGNQTRPSRVLSCNLFFFFFLVQLKVARGPGNELLLCN